MKHHICLLLTLLIPFSLLRAEEFLPEGYAFEKGGVVLELFTSEGCSSCPPVDLALQKLVEEAETKNVPIHLVSWHVDYWDKLRTMHGVWKDPYSSKSHTHRQRAYSAAFVKQGMQARPRLVTPQFLLNGRLRKSFDAKKLMDQFKEASALIEAGQVTGAAEQGENAVSVSWALKEDVALDAHTLTVVLTESDLTSKITAGENFGKTLVHNHVVRASHILKPEDAKGTVNLPLPSDWKGTGAAVMVLLQNDQFQVVDFLRVPLVPTAEAQDMTRLEAILHNSGVCTPDGCKTENPVAAETVHLPPSAKPTTTP